MCSRQAGRYQKALELAERAKEIEETELGARRDRMADIYQMCANAMDEVCCMTNLIHTRQCAVSLGFFENMHNFTENLRAILALI